MVEACVSLQAAGRRFSTRGGLIDALSGATCSIHAGDRIAIMGASGSGKSTLMALMAGLDQPTTGAISWPGLAAGMAPRPAYIGVVFQSPSLIPSLTVAENIEVPLLIINDREDRAAKVAMALEAVGLAHTAERLPEELSGGQVQRVGVARALVTSPRLLLADEPTGQLDQETAQRLIDMLLGWASRSAAALVVSTHDPAVARHFATVWHLRHGRLETGQALKVAS